MPYMENARRPAGADLTAECRFRQHNNQPIFGIPDARLLARLLGGEASGNRILAPGPGHSSRDRFLSIRLDPSAQEGFVVHSFARDDPLACRDHVRAVLGLPAVEWHQARSGVAAAPRGLTGVELRNFPDLRFHGTLRFDGRVVAGTRRRTKASGSAPSSTD